MTGLSMMANGIKTKDMAMDHSLRRRKMERIIWKDGDYKWVGHTYWRCKVEHSDVTNILNSHNMFNKTPL